MKQKKRQKLPAKSAIAQVQHTVTTSEHPQAVPVSRLPEPQHSHHSYIDSEPYDPGNGDEIYDSEDYDEAYAPESNGASQLDPSMQNGAGKKSKKKRNKKGGGTAPPHEPLANNHHTTANLPPPPPPPPALTRTKSNRHDRDRIWNTSTEEERSRIKEFWLSLGEDDRKSLVKIEKEAVLRKMKEQQKQSCSCTVCGRKRHAIEEELEVLYDAYYDELEQYAHSTIGDVRHESYLREMVSHPVPPSLLANGAERQPMNRIDPNRIMPPQHSRIHELHDEDEDELEEDELDEEEEYSDEEYDDYSDDDLDYATQAQQHPPGPAQDLFNFGQHLTVKGGILTVADDLLKNDGKKFIDMMEQLAERRMAREEDAQYNAQSGAHHRYGHEQGLGPEDEEYEDEDDEDYDSQDEEYDEDEEIMDSMTEEQRMQEGRRMFQIFAARMFEQRVLQAYRQKVSDERQAKLVLELEEEQKVQEEREAKKARDAQKKREKKKAQQQAKAEEKAKKEAELAAQEAAKKAEEEKKQEEQRKKKEEQRLKKEAEKKAKDELRLKQEAERQKRAQEERERQQEAERKVKEQKAAEKRAREETKKREREERQVKEKEDRDKKAAEEKSRKDRETQQQALLEDRERPRRDDITRPIIPTAANPPALLKRPSQMAAVAVPPGLSKQASQSPRLPVATPAIQKAPTPKGPKQTSRYPSHTSSPRNSNAGTVAKSISPIQSYGAQAPIQPKQILTKPQPPPQVSHVTQPLPPPPGFMDVPRLPVQHNVASFGAPPGFQSYQNHNMLPVAGRVPSIGQQMPGYQNHNPLVPGQYRGFPPVNGVPSAINGAGASTPIGSVPPGFPPQNPIGTPQVGNQMPHFSGNNRDATQTHSRQQSGSDKQEKSYEPAPIGAPISRPAPIARPSSVAPHDSGLEDESKESGIDDLTQHLGSKALLAGSEGVETLEPTIMDGRRTSGQLAGLPRAQPFTSPFAGPAQLHNHAFSSTWGGAGASIGLPTPSLGGFSSPQVQGTWGPSNASPNTTWNNAPFGSIGRSAGSQIAQGLPQPVTRQTVVRKLAAQASRELNKLYPRVQFHDALALHHRIDSMRLPDIGPVSALEVLQTIESNKAGSYTNGGGRFEVQRDPQQNRTFVKFTDDVPGAIGVPGGGAAPFGGLGVSGLGSNDAGAVGQGTLADTAPFGGLGAKPPFMANGQSSMGF